MKLVKDTNTENEIKKVSDKEAEDAFKTILSENTSNNCCNAGGNLNN